MTVSRIVSQSVKDVLQTLVDDNLVDTDKIGTSVYFWAFPSKATATRKNRLAEVEGQVEQANKRLKTAEANLKEVKKGREEGKERNEVSKKDTKFYDEKSKAI